MEFPNSRVIEKLHAKLDEEKRSREEAVSRAAGPEHSWEGAVLEAELDQQQVLKDIARNILQLGLSVEEVTQATGLPRKTVQTLAARL
jgi:predicted transposase YdaD